MLIKLNCFSIKRNIYEDAASTADLLVFCTHTDFLMSSPTTFPFLPGCYIFLLSAVIFCPSREQRDESLTYRTPAALWHPLSVQ